VLRERKSRRRRRRRRMKRKKEDCNMWMETISR